MILEQVPGQGEGFVQLSRILQGVNKHGLEIGLAGPAGQQLAKETEGILELACFLVDVRQRGLYLSLETPTLPATSGCPPGKEAAATVRWRFSVRLERPRFETTRGSHVSGPDCLPTPARTLPRASSYLRVRMSARPNSSSILGSCRTAPFRSTSTASAWAPQPFPQKLSGDKSELGIRQELRR